jgi:predicted nucleic acid-binding protein
VSKLPIVLDSAALSDLAAPGARGPAPFLWSLLEEAWSDEREVLVPTVVCAEVCCSVARTRAVEALLNRHDPQRKQRSPIRLVDTNYGVARLVGTVLDAGRAGSEDLVDAHLVAISVARGGGLIVTSDPEDLERLSAPFVGARIVVRSLRT